MKELLNTYKQIIMYLIFGVLTTAVNIVTYYICTSLISMNYMISNIFAWLFSVLFAYVTNRKYVFVSKNASIFKEMLSFFASRLSTGAMDMAFMYILVDMMSANDIISKVAVNVLVIVANYILSKLFVFKKGE